VLYRQADESDIPGMARIRAAEWELEEYWRARISAYMDCKLHPRQALMPRVIYVALEDHSLVGFVAGHLTRRYACDGELQWIDVTRERRRGGIASELLRRLAAWFVEQKALRICVDVDPANATARRFYRRHGAENLNQHWLVWNDINVVLGERRSAGRNKLEEDCTMSGTEASKAAATGFECVVPILRVRSLPASIDYYVNVLGFKVDWHEPGIMASVSRDRCHIMLCEGDQGNPGTWVWIGVEDCQRLFEEYKSRGAKVRHPPTNYQWAYEMQIEDPDGNVLRMGSDPKPGQPIGEWLDMRGDIWVKSPAGGWTRVERG